MKCDHAKAFVDNLALLPGWRVATESWNHRYEGTVKVTVWVDNPDTNDTSLSDETGNFEGIIEGGVHAHFLLIVGDLDDGDYATLTYRFLTQILQRVFLHEMREALRDKRTHTSWLHPHRISGQRVWAELNNSEVHEDLHYGVVQ